MLRESLVAARQAAGLTQTQLARKIGRHQSFVAKVEGGERRIDLVELLEIAAAIDMNISRVVRLVAAEL
jgi:transcriptional regulator with XRE-family HTH domain